MDTQRDQVYLDKLYLVSKTFYGNLKQFLYLNVLFPGKLKKNIINLVLKFMLRRFCKNRKK